MQCHYYNSHLHDHLAIVLCHTDPVTGCTFPHTKSESHSYRTYSAVDSISNSIAYPLKLGSQFPLLHERLDQHQTRCFPHLADSKSNHDSRRILLDQAHSLVLSYQNMNRSSHWLSSQVIRVVKYLIAPSYETRSSFNYCNNYYTTKWYHLHGLSHQNWSPRTNFGCQNRSPGPISAAKSGPPCKTESLYPAHARLACTHIDNVRMRLSSSQLARGPNLPGSN